MAKELDLDRLISLLQPTSAKLVEKVLDRARAASAAESKRVLQDGASAGRSFDYSREQILRSLALAIAFHGRSRKEGVSIRPTAKDTGGRSFHFSHTTTSRTGGGGSKSGAGGGGKASAAGSDPERPMDTASGGAKAGAAMNREAAHQAYVERESAVAREAGDDGLEHAGRTRKRGPANLNAEPQVERDEAGRDRNRAPGRDTLSAVEAKLSSAHMATATAAQGYIEDPAKVDQRHGNANSFGTIGKTYEERLKFWDLVNEHEREKDARTQTRLVLELPHEASDKDRQRIVRDFCAWYEERGIPYWAAIHAPTKKNDNRNHHAHVVHMDRPARQMRHPETGVTVWDFTISQKKRDATRHYKTTYPYRQKKSPALRNIDHVKQQRQRFAEVTNSVMAASGNKVRYDARSYKDMGLGIEPMKNVSRVMADKMKSHDYVVMDAEWTRRMIEREMAVAALARDKTLQRLDKVERQLQDALKDIQKPASVNRKLPEGMKVAHNSRLTKPVAQTAAKAILTAERDRLTEKLVREATRKTLADIVQATDPLSAKKAGSARRVYKDAGETPDLEALAHLHEAAKKQLQEHDAETRSWRMKTADRLRAAYGRWNRHANPDAGAPPPQPMPATAKPTVTVPRPPEVIAAATPPDAQRRVTFPPATPAPPQLQREPPTVNILERMLGGPNSLARRIHASVTAQLDSIAKLIESGEISHLTPEIMTAAIQAQAMANAAVREHLANRKKALDEKAQAPEPGTAAAERPKANAQPPAGEDRAGQSPETVQAPGARQAADTGQKATAQQDEKALPEATRPRIRDRLEDLGITKRASTPQRQTTADRMAPQTLPLQRGEPTTGYRPVSAEPGKMADRPLERDLPTKPKPASKQADDHSSGGPTTTRKEPPPKEQSREAVATPAQPTKATQVAKAKAAQQEQPELGLTDAPGALLTDDIMAQVRQLADARAAAAAEKASAPQNADAETTPKARKKKNRRRAIITRTTIPTRSR